MTRGQGEEVGDTSKKKILPDSVYVDWNNFQCPRAGWNILLKTHFPSQTIKSSHSQWKNSNSIESYLKRITIRDKIQAARMKEKQKSGKFFHVSFQDPKLGNATAMLTNSRVQWAIRI